jgi:hypothetical protein
VFLQADADEEGWQRECVFATRTLIPVRSAHALMLYRLSSSASVTENTSAVYLVPTSAEEGSVVHDVCPRRSKNRSEKKSHPSPLSLESKQGLCPLPPRSVVFSELKNRPARMSGQIAAAKLQRAAAAPTERERMGSLGPRLQPADLAPHREGKLSDERLNCSRSIAAPKSQGSQRPTRAKGALTLRCEIHYLHSVIKTIWVSSPMKEVLILTIESTSNEDGHEAESLF